MKPFTLEWWLRLHDYYSAISYYWHSKGDLRRRAKYEIRLKWVSQRIINKYGDQDA